MKFRRQADATGLVVWLVASTASLQCLFQAADAQLQGSWGRFWLWCTAAIAMGAVSALVETVKRTKEKHA